MAEENAIVTPATESVAAAASGDGAAVATVQTEQKSRAASLIAEAEQAANGGNPIDMERLKQLLAQEGVTLPDSQLPILLSILQNKLDDQAREAARMAIEAFNPALKDLSTKGAAAAGAVAVSNDGSTLAVAGVDTQGAGAIAATGGDGKPSTIATAVVTPSPEDKTPAAVTGAVGPNTGLLLQQRASAAADQNLHMAV